MDEESWRRHHGGGIVEEGLAGQGRSQARGSLGPENVRFCLRFHGKCELREGETRTGATQRSRSIEFYHALGGTGTGRERPWWEEKLSILAAGNRARKTLR